MAGFVAHDGLDDIDDEERELIPRDGAIAGVPCWIDVVQPDPDATMAFYADLFGWTYEVRTPPEAPATYAYARKDDLLVAGVGGPPSPDGPWGWTQYLWVDSADDAAAAVEAGGGRVVSAPTDIPGAGRMAVCTDPFGGMFGLWEAGENRGVQLVNVDGSWNFTNLVTADREGADAFYRSVFGWERESFGPDDSSSPTFWKVPGYGAFLADHDPEIKAWQESGQHLGGFSDSVAWLDTDPSATTARWDVTFGVDDADAAFTRALDLGATERTPLFDTPWTRQGVVVDPQGAALTLSQYKPEG